MKPQKCRQDIERLVDECSKKLEVVQEPKCQQDIEKLVDECSLKLQRDPACLHTRAIRGHACMKVARWELAATDFSEILEVRKDDVHGTFCRGMAYFKSGKIREALTDFSAVLDLDSKHAMARYARAGCYSIHGDMNSAINDYTVALNCDSRSRQRSQPKLYLHEKAERVLNEKLSSKRGKSSDRATSDSVTNSSRKYRKVPGSDIGHASRLSSSRSSHSHPLVTEPPDSTLNSKNSRTSSSCSTDSAPQLRKPIKVVLDLTNQVIMKKKDSKIKRVQIRL